MKTVIEKDFDVDEYYKFGRKIYGPFLLAYSDWMYKKIVEKKTSSIFCLSRDGYMMKKGLEIIARREKSEINIKYLYCSRKSLRQALLYTSKNYIESLKYLTFRKVVTVNIILDYYGFNDKEIHEMSDRDGIRIDREIKYIDIENDKEIEELYEKNKEKILERSQRQAHYLYEYLLKIGFSDKVAVADIGWHGSMQYYLEEFCNLHHIDVEILGLYIGNHSFLPIRGELEGFLFRDSDLKKRQSVMCFFGVLEKLFQSHEGSTLSYEMKGNEVIACLDEYEYVEDEEITKCIKMLQEGALECMKNSCCTNIRKKDYKKLTGPLLHIGKYPTLANVNMFSFFYNIEGEEKAYFVAQKKLFEYTIAELKHSLCFSSWKTGFFKSLFKIPFPYYLIYKVVS